MNRALTIPISVLLMQCAAPSVPSRVVVAPPLESIGALVPLGYLDDRVALNPGPPRADGELDFGFGIRIVGEVVAIGIYSASLDGTPNWVICWDTLDAGPMHLGAIGVCGTPTKTWTLAVIDATGTLRNPAIDLPPGTRFEGRVTLQLADPRRSLMRGGRVFTVLVERPSGRLDRASATLP